MNFTKKIHQPFIAFFKALRLKFQRDAVIILAADTWSVLVAIILLRFFAFKTAKIICVPKKCLLKDIVCILNIDKWPSNRKVFLIGLSFDSEWDGSNLVELIGYYGHSIVSVIDQKYSIWMETVNLVSMPVSVSELWKVISPLGRFDQKIKDTFADLQKLKEGRTGPVSLLPETIFSVDNNILARARQFIIGFSTRQIKLVDQLISLVYGDITQNSEKVIKSREDLSSEYFPKNIVAADASGMEIDKTRVFRDLHFEYPFALIRNFRFQNRLVTAISCCNERVDLHYVLVRGGIEPVLAYPDEVYILPEDEPLSVDILNKICERSCLSY